MRILTSFLFTSVQWKFGYIEDGEEKEIVFDSIQDAADFCKESGFALDPLTGCGDC